MESTKSRLVRLGGVPEQVNIPIEICLKRGIFAKYNVDVEFTEIRQGTGRMLDMLEKDEIDVALTVTDAFMVGKSKSRKVSLCGTFVSSPLVWAIAGAYTTETKSIWDNKPVRFGISRLGSGSHTMATYAAIMNNVDPSVLEFVIANDIEGLIDGVKSGTFDCFMWETFTTHPYFESKELSKLDDVPTPWPAFSVVTQSRGDREAKNALIKDAFFSAIKEGIDIFLAEAKAAVSSSSDEIPPTIASIVKDFGHTAENAALWMSRVQYADSSTMAVDLGVTRNSLSILKQIGLIDEEFPIEGLWTKDDGYSNGIITIQ